LSSAVVQVFWAEAPHYNQWNKRWCGVATFVKDNGKHSYYIRIFDLKVTAQPFDFDLTVFVTKLLYYFTVYLSAVKFWSE